jgi:threonine dehydratase
MTEELVKKIKLPELNDIQAAKARMSGVVTHTPLN